MFRCVSVQICLLLSIFVTLRVHFVQILTHAHLNACRCVRVLHALVFFPQHFQLFLATIEYIYWHFDLFAKFMLRKLTGYSRNALSIAVFNKWIMHVVNELIASKIYRHIYIYIYIYYIGRYIYLYVFIAAISEWKLYFCATVL